MWFRVDFDSKICRFYCRPNGKWPNRGKRYLKFSRFYCAARRIWRKRVGKRIRNDSKHYKTNGKPPNEGSGKYFCTEYLFLYVQNKSVSYRDPPYRESLCGESFYRGSLYRVTYECTSALGISTLGHLSRTPWLAKGTFAFELIWMQVWNEFGLYSIWKQIWFKIYSELITNVFRLYFNWIWPGVILDLNWIPLEFILYSKSI